MKKGLKKYKKTINKNKTTSDDIKLSFSVFMLLHQMGDDGTLKRDKGWYQNFILVALIDCPEDTEVAESARGLAKNAVEKSRKIEENVAQKRAEFRDGCNFKT